LSLIEFFLWPFNGSSALDPNYSDLTSSSNSPSGPPELEDERHEAKGVSRAAQAGVVGADQGRDPVEGSFLDLVAVYEPPGHLQDAAADGEVVVARCDDQVGPGHGAVVVHLVVVDERAARSLDYAGALEVVHAGMGANLGAENGRIGEQLRHALEGVRGLDQSRVVVVETALDDAAEPLAVFRQLGVGIGRAAAVGDVETGQRADAVDAVGKADRLEVRRLEVRVGEGRFADVGRVVGRFHLVGDEATFGVDEAQVSVVEPKRAVRPDEAAVHGGEVREGLDLVREAVVCLLPEGECPLHDGHGRRQLGEYLVPRLRVERGVDAARHDPRGVDAFLGQPFDGLLSELSQRYPVAQGIRVLLEQSRHVSLCRIEVHAQQQVRRREMEERQCVGLNELGAVEQFAQLRRGLRNAHGHDLVAGFGGGQLVAHRADAADARRNRRHLVVRPALDELLEAAYLGHVELRVGDLAGVVELDRDPGVALDARHVVDRDLLHRSPGLRRQRRGCVGHGLLDRRGERRPACRVRRRFPGRHRLLLPEPQL
jgi:hypothetical protein